MSITPLLKNQAFAPEVTAAMGIAFESACARLRLSRSDSATEAIAKKIIALAQQGERDPLVLCERALKELNLGD
jgi:hypothetical protein